MLCKIVTLLMIGAVLDIQCLNRKLCELDDAVCVTRVCKEAYPTLIAGFPDAGVDTLDPVEKDEIKTELPGLNLTFKDAFLQGLKGCDVKEVRIHQNTSSWEFELICPLLTFKSKYEINGKISSLNISGQGYANIVYDKYHIKIKGEYIKITLNDGDHMKLKNYAVDSKVNGVLYNFTNLYSGDIDKSAAAHRYLNENLMETKKFMHDPIIYNFMGTFFDHLNKFLIIVPNEELFAYELD